MGYRANEFNAFSEAKTLASQLAESFNISVEIINSNGKFVVQPAAVPLPNFKKFSDSIYVFGSVNYQVLSLLSHVDASCFRSTRLTWLDLESGLLWDSSRLLSGIASTVLSTDRSAVMNAVGYGGSSNWRLPTLDELSTLDLIKLDKAGIGSYRDADGSVKFWSSNESIYSGPETAFLEIVSKRRGDQRYREQNKDRQMRGDGYMETAQTIMVADSTC
jgi:hypothetical protein